MWFETLKEQLIDLGFAQAATDDDDNIGKLGFPPGQLKRVLNLNENEVTTDGTSKWMCGHPTTRIMSSTNEKSIQGVTRAHKNSYVLHLLVEVIWPIGLFLQIFNWSVRQKMRTLGLIWYIYFKT